MVEARMNAWIRVRKCLPAFGEWVEVRARKPIKPRIWRMKRVGYTDGWGYFWDDYKDDTLQPEEVEAWRVIKERP